MQSSHSAWAYFDAYMHQVSQAGSASVANPEDLLIGQGQQYIIDPTQLSGGLRVY